jgi:hypothetical protein
VRSDGIVATNEHVIRAAYEIVPPAIPPEDHGIIVVGFRQLPKMLVKVNLDVLFVARDPIVRRTGEYYGPEKPDIAFVQVKAGDLPSLNLDDALVLEEGLNVATSGFTMGRDLLTAPGWLQQICPTLQAGIISAVLPWPCENPHGFVVNVMIQGGASGSPVFLPESGSVIGMLHSSAVDLDSTQNIRPAAPPSAGLTSHDHLVTVPTNLSFALTAKVIKACLHTPAVAGLVLPKDCEAFDDLVLRYSRQLSD